MWNTDGRLGGMPSASGERGMSRLSADFQSLPHEVPARSNVRAGRLIGPGIGGDRAASASFPGYALRWLQSLAFLADVAQGGHRHRPAGGRCARWLGIRWLRADVVRPPIDSSRQARGGVGAGFLRLSEGAGTGVECRIAHRGWRYPPQVAREQGRCGAGCGGRAHTGRCPRSTFL